MIQSVHAREILDGSGTPCIEITVITPDGVSRGHSSCMISSGPFEGINIYDEQLHRYEGKGVAGLSQLINEIAHKALVGFEAIDQIYLDKRLVENLDGTANAYGWSASKLGRNTLSAISIAVAKAGALHHGIPIPMYIGFISDNSIARLRLPRPVITVISGGLLGGSLTAIESIFIIPKRTDTFKHAIQVAYEVKARIAELLVEIYGVESLNLSGEGAYSPPTSDIDTLLEIVARAVHEKGNGLCGMGMDVGAPTFFVKGFYDLSWKLQERQASKCEISPKLSLEVCHAPLTPALWRQKLISWIKTFQLELVIDPIGLETGHTVAIQSLTREYAGFSTIALQRVPGSQPSLVKQFCNISNGIVVAPSMLASVTETLASCQAVKENDSTLIVSCANRETEDTFVSDLAVGVSADFLKIGGLESIERTVKINQILRIEEDLGDITNFRD